MAAAVAAPAFGQKTATQLDDLTGTMTQYTQPKAHAPARAATTAKAQASTPVKPSRRSTMAPLPEKPVRSEHEGGAAATRPASSSHDITAPRQLPRPANRATPAPSAPKVATTPRQQAPPLPARAPVVAPSAAAVTISTGAPASTSKGGATAAVAEQDDGGVRFWRRPWSWIAGAVVLALLLLEVVGWRRHHRRKRDATVLANIVPTATPGDREADYHPRPSHPPDRSRQSGAG
jgi:hypothetical protein